MIDKRWKCWNFVKYKFGKWWKNRVFFEVLLLFAIIVVGLSIVIFCITPGQYQLPPTAHWCTSATQPELEDPFNLIMLLPIVIVGAGIFAVIFGSGCWGSGRW